MKINSTVKATVNKDFFKYKKMVSVGVGKGRVHLIWENNLTKTMCQRPVNNETWFFVDDVHPVTCQHCKIYDYGY